jgi:hypothetical protein
MRILILLPFIMSCVIDQEAPGPTLYRETKEKITGVQSELSQIEHDFVAPLMKNGNKFSWKSALEFLRKKGDILDKNSIDLYFKKLDNIPEVYYGKQKINKVKRTVKNNYFFRRIPMYIQAPNGRFVLNYLMFDVSKGLFFLRNTQTGRQIEFSIRKGTRDIKSSVRRIR